ncbi:Uncharacterised protein [Candidatus Tiddalikarchaeum anstoanum]|nr:Uncharacterised protein [Candidatus Tiddalikarchaeum anstoanum]
MNMIINSIEGMILNAKSYAKDGKTDLVEFCLKPIYEIFEKNSVENRESIEAEIRNVRIMAYSNLLKSYVSKIEKCNNAIFSKVISQTLNKIKSLDPNLGLVKEKELENYLAMTGQ